MFATFRPEVLSNTLAEGKRRANFSGSKVTTKNSARLAAQLSPTPIMLYALLADLIVAIHIAYVVYVVGGLVAILIGAWRGRKWIRNPWFRVTYLLAILIVVMETFLKLNCPLTSWENQARAAAQQPVDGSAFMD